MTTNHDENGPTDLEIEDLEIDRQIDRQIEYSEEAFRGEHGEEAQREEVARRKAFQLEQQAKLASRKEEEARELETNRLTDALGSPALVKACQDNYFDYALKLKSGEVIRFKGAVWRGNGWLTLTDVVQEIDMPVGQKELPYPAARGVDVRLESILWVMDAPCGS